MLYEFFILQELKTNNEIIDEEINNEQMFFDNEKFVLFFKYLVYIFNL